MTPLSDSLLRLIEIAEDVMRRPAQRSIVALPPGFTAIASEVRRVHALPADLSRTTQAGVIMCEAIEAFAGKGSDRWQMLIGATLPLLRSEAFEAFRNEKQSATEEFRR